MLGEDWKYHEDETLMLIPFKMYCELNSVSFVKTTSGWMYMGHNNNKYAYKLHSTRQTILINDSGILIRGSLREDIGDLGEDE